MNLDTENRLREAFAARTALISEGQLVEEWTPPVAAPVRSHVARRGVFIAGLAAAAVILVVVGTTVGVRLSSQPAKPAVPVTSVAPSPSNSVSEPNPSPSPVAPSTNPVASQPVVVPTQVLALKFGNLATVSVTVPLSWGLSESQPTGCCNTPGSICLTKNGTDYAHDPQNCELAVTVQAGQGLDPNVPWPASYQPECKTWTTTQEADATVSG